MNSSLHNKEIELIKNIAGSFLRHPKQFNKLFEADAEIIDFRDVSPDYLVFKLDGINEEIKEKLYEDPYLIGWMSVTVTVSDLAAVGCEPLGLLLSLQISKDFNESWMKQFRKGINDACETYETKILGGDTNFDNHLAVTTAGIGIINQNRPLIRKNISPGDLLYSTALLGRGNAFAYSRFFNSSIKVNYKPTARIKESKIIRQYAGACIDTSDGLFPALSVLGELNDTGFKFSSPLRNILCNETRMVSEVASIPSWIFLAGPHGEYELLFTISPSIQNEFEKVCSKENWMPVLLGEIVTGKQVKFLSEQTQIQCDPSEIANLFGESEGNIHRYFQMLMQKHEQWIKNKTAVC